MNAAWHRIVKLVYRKEPISASIAVAGVVDIAIGGFDGSGSLLTFGIATVAIAIAYRVWQLRRASDRFPETAPDYSLPPSSSTPPLPHLTSRHQRQSR